MTLKTSLLITGDSSIAKKAVDDLAASNRGLGASGKEAAAGLAAQERAEIEAAAAGKAMVAAQAAVAEQLHQTQAAAAGYEASLRQSQSTIAGLQASNAALGGELRQARAAAAGFEAQIAATSAAAATAGGSLDALGAELAGVKGELASLQSANGQLANDLQRAQAMGAGLAGELAEVRQAAGGTAAELERLRTDATAASGEITRLGAANVALEGELRGTQAAAGALAAELKDAQQSIAGMAGRIDVLETRLKGSGKAMREGAVDAERHAAGVRNFGQQFGDLAVMIQGGISPARAFATQAGQMGYAMSEMGGKAGAVGRVLVGPLGIALTVATAALAPLVEELIAGGEAAKKVELGSSGLADAQGALGQMFDLTTGKLKKQNSELAASNELLRLNIRLTAINLRAESAKEEASSAKTFGSAGSISIGNRIKGAFTDGRLFGTVRGAIDGTEQGRTNAGNLQTVVRDLQAGRTTNEQVLRASEKLDFTGLKVSREEFQAAIRDGVSSRAKREIAALADKSLDAGSVAGALRQDSPSRKTKKASGAVAEFGRDAADKIASIVGQFDAAPAVIDKANAKVRELDDLIEDLGRRKPAGFQKLVEEAEAAKVTVRSGLIRELAEGFEKPKTLADKAAVAFGQLDAVVADLQARKPPSFEKLIGEAKDARAAIEAGLNKPLDDFLTGQREQLAQNALLVSGRRDEAEALRAIIAIEKQRPPLTAEQRAQVLASVVALRLQEQQLERIHARQQVNLDALSSMRDIVRTTLYEGPQSVAKLPGRLLDSFKNYSVDKMAEDLFGDLFRDLRNQVTGAGRVDAASVTLVNAFTQTAAAATQLSAALTAASNTPTNAGGTAGAVAGVGAATTGAVQASNDEADDVVVKGRRRSDIYGDTIAGVLGKLGIGKDTAKDIGRGAGKALAGAMQGQAAAGVAGMLGIKTSSTGAGIGGAIGGLTGLPGGAIVGGLLGGIAGGLLKKTKSGSATIGDTTSAATTSGNSGAFQKVASGLAGNVQDSIAQIASQLGGSVAAFAPVTIGKYGESYKVNTTGASTLKKGKSGVVDFDEDEAGAVAFAVKTAIERGAIGGLSTAVQKAIGSSSDVNKALKEALAVQDVETLIGGQLAQYQKAFRDFEAQAAERVRIASQYGFDVVAIEKRNAEDRTKLATELARAQTGSLQQLIDEMASGTLFEGNALDRITALNDAISKAKSDLDNNVEGAGDRLASLYEQRLSASKEAYGSTSKFAADRTATIGEAQAAIAKVNAQIAQANQAKSDPALTMTNATLDEISDQQSRFIAEQKRTNALLAGMSGSGGVASGGNLAQLAAY